MRRQSGKLLRGAVAWSLRIGDVAFIRGQAVDALERHEPSRKTRTVTKVFRVGLVDAGRVRVALIPLSRSPTPVAADVVIGVL